jgi:hypothetical protein
MLKGIFILEVLKMEEEMELALNFFQKGNIILEILKMIFFMDKDFIFGIKIKHTLVFSKMVKKYLEP